MTQPVQIRSERISPEAYIAFLARTDLGSQYPKERFAERIRRLVASASISLIARDESGTIVGVCFGITDFAYWLFITDLGVDRAYVRQGLGRRLVQMALDAAGGSRDIILYTCANERAIPFYEKIGMRKAEDVMVLNQVDWTAFTVGDQDDIPCAEVNRDAHQGHAGGH